MARDDFNADTKDELAKRVGVRCSNPQCRQSTSGPRDDPAKSINIGVAAHICAASEGGPRYHREMPAEQRASINNGIWLCQNCAKMVDNDVARFSVRVLLKWKEAAELAARNGLEGRAVEARILRDDVDLIRFFAQCLDRPAFQDKFRDEGSIEALDKAIEDTITAINTGCLRTRDGAVVAQAAGKSNLQDAMWREQMDGIVDLLRSMRLVYDKGLKLGSIRVSDQRDGQVFYVVHDRNFGNRIDKMRYEILRIFANVASQAGVIAPVFPRSLPSNW